MNNLAEKENGEKVGGELCAYQNGTASKLGVAPCFVPKFFAGPYGIVAYNEDEGWALASGGQPTIQVGDGCKTGTGLNNSGLWIFTREHTRDNDIVNKVRNVAKSKGFDITVLNDVDQTNCDGRRRSLAALRGA